MKHDDLFIKYFNLFAKEHGYTFYGVKSKLKSEKVKNCIKEINLVDKFRLKHYWITEEMLCKQFDVRVEYFRDALYYKKNTYDY